MKTEETTIEGSWEGLFFPTQPTVVGLLNNIIELTNNTPNDMELGGKIRELLS